MNEFANPYESNFEAIGLYCEGLCTREMIWSDVEVTLGQLYYYTEMNKKLTCLAHLLVANKKVIVSDPWHGRKYVALLALGVPKMYCVIVVAVR